MKNRRITGLISLIAIVVITGCGVSDRSISNAEKQIEKLKTMGIPDSALSQAKVFVYQAKSAKERGQTAIANKAADSMIYYISQAEKMYNEHILKLVPVIDSLQSIIKSANEEFSGLQQKKIDSTMAVIDSLVSIKWYLPAHTKAKELEGQLEQFKIDEKKSAELRPKLFGKWICTNVTKSTENKLVHAVEKKIFNFKKNGKVALIENKKGRSSPFLKEDWEFKSWGTYDLAGDTIFLSINRFASVRQNFKRLNVENGKKVWTQENQPVYDSTITDGSQDRFITYADLKVDFKKK